MFQVVSILLLQRQLNLFSLLGQHFNVMFGSQVRGEMDFRLYEDIAHFTFLLDLVVGNVGDLFIRTAAQQGHLPGLLSDVIQVLRMSLCSVLLLLLDLPLELLLHVLLRSSDHLQPLLPHLVLHGGRDLPLLHSSCLLLFDPLLPLLPPLQHCGLGSKLLPLYGLPPLLSLGFPLLPLARLLSSLLSYLSQPLPTVLLCMLDLVNNVKLVVLSL